MWRFVRNDNFEVSWFDVTANTNWITENGSHITDAHLDTTAISTTSHHLLEIQIQNAQEDDVGS